jgi:4-hydroxy-2-oxoheptanedioate aldolase
MPAVGGVQIWANAGVDVLAFDLEHGHIDPTTLHALIAATAGTDVVPAVRVAANVPWLVKQALDAGAMGIVFPLIRNAADAADAVAACRYPPHGIRGWGPFFAAQRRGFTVAEYVARADDEVLVIILVELPEAVDDIEALVAVPGIDIISVAMRDLSLNMGHPDDLAHPEVVAAVRRVEQAALGAGVALNGFAADPEAAAALKARGYRSRSVGFDWLVYQRAVTEALALPTAAGERSEPGGAQP